MKILMTGPGKGSNIKIWLDYFNSQKEIDYHFLSEGSYEFDRAKYDRVKLFYEVKWSGSAGKAKNLLNLMKKLATAKFDVVHIHGMYNIYLTFIYMFFSRGCKKVVNIWGEKFVKQAANPKTPAEKFLYNYVLAKSDAILINWWGVYHLFCQSFPQYKHKVQVNPWGINEEVLRLGTTDCTEEITQKYGIGKNDILIGSIRGISPVNNQNLIIDALQILRTRLSGEVFQRLKFISINGFNYETDYVKVLQDQVKQLGLEANVIIDDKTCLTVAQAMAFHERADIEPFISSSDQLSNTIIEAMSKKTYFILSNIEAYRILNDQYHLNLELIDLNSQVLADKLETEIKKIVAGQPTELNVFDKLRENFIFENNVKKIVNIYKTLGK